MNGRYQYQDPNKSILHLLLFPVVLELPIVVDKDILYTTVLKHITELV